LKNITPEELQFRSFKNKGYDESSKTFHIGIPGQRKIETRRDILEEDIVFQRSIESQRKIDSVGPKVCT
jgi:hypothetical protein